ncbi:hypothetical protein C8R44DRAFT_680875 [Mycena epipterygia]|nr:hypothetical protein C8R44DRAFT_680875 [Mycena epipterygia]
MPVGCSGEPPEAYHISSPYKDLLYTNFAPSDDECRCIRDLLAVSTKELKDTTEEISRLQDALDQLVHKEDVLTEFVDAHLALVSPARRLAPDIWAEIFTACLPSHGMPMMDSSKSPLLISHVCSDWRRLVLSMPQLWTSLHIEARANWSPSTATLFNKGLKTWLPRSGSLPLSISYVVHSYDSIRPNTLLLRTLVNSSQRWGHMRFKLPSFEDFRPLGKISPDDVPVLASVVIDTSQGDSVVGDSLAFFSFIRGEEIRRLSLRCLERSGLRDIIPWSQLRHLSLKFRYPITLAQALDVLRKCSNLETCIFLIYEGRTTILPTPEPIYMEGLQQLCITDTSEGGTHLFDYIVLPNLQSLEYSNRHNNPAQILASLCAPEKLTRLGLSAPVSNDLAQILLRFPMLQKLVMHRPRETLTNNGTISCPLFQLLTPEPNGPAATSWPRLQSICFLGLDVGTDEELLDLIHARRTCADIPPLSGVHVAFPRAQQVDIAPQLKSLAPMLRYPTDSELRFITYTPNTEPRLAQNTNHPAEVWEPVRSRPKITALKVKPDSVYEPDDDWRPISSGWLEDYAKWGL